MTKMMLESKQPQVGTTIFTVMSRLAQEQGAINLSQGFPDFDTHEGLKERLAYYVEKGYNQYPPMPGVMSLREAVSEKTQALHQTYYDPESEVTIVSGGTEALYAAITAVVRLGDEVLIFEPAYDSYAPAIRLNGGIPVFHHLQPPHYQVDWGKVASQVTDKTRLVMVNTPQNPTGRTWKMEDWENLYQIIQHRNCFLISDEVYEHIVFDGQEHSSACRHEGLRERAFVVGSFGKTFHATGWKTGSCLAPKMLTTEFRKVHQWLTFTTFTPVQHALADYLRTPAHYLGVSDFYQRKRDLFVEAMRGSRFEFFHSEGSYFINAFYKNISDAPDFEFAQRLTIEHKVAVIPVSVFYNDQNDYQVVRFCFAKKDETLLQAANILCNL